MVASRRDGHHGHRVDGGAQNSHGGPTYATSVGHGARMERHVVEVLYAERCRFVPLAIERVREAIAPKRAELDVEIRLIQVETNDDAIRRSFPGSPTVRVDGYDVDPDGARNVGLHGRAYLTNGDVDHAPQTESIHAALTASVRARQCV